MKVPSHWTDAPSAGAPGVPATASGTVGNLSFQQLASMLSSRFASAALFPAPMATGTNGNRTTAVTTDSEYVSSVNGQSGAIQIGTLEGQVTAAALVGGLYTWTFTSPFNNNPAVVAFPIGNSPSAGLFAQAVSPTAAIIQSTSGSDARTIMIIAVGDPN